MIYSITFHRKPGRKVQTFWFTDKNKALRFYESVKAFPKVIDARFFCIRECQSDTYYDSLIEPDFVAVDCMVKA